MLVKYSKQRFRPMLTQAEVADSCNLYLGSNGHFFLDSELLAWLFLTKIVRNNLLLAPSLIILNVHKKPDHYPNSRAS